jgi:NAD(P)-dependent dehydrogenase (short-subunit alcohol dehydrogenase family)
MDRVKHKVAIVTGGAVGIGKATCLLLAKEGAKIAITDINKTEGESLVQEIRQTGGIADFWSMNVSNEDEVKKTFQKIEEKFNKIDILVNNAGIGGVDKPTHELTEEEWDTVMNINVKGVFFCTKHVIPYMLKIKAGSIINIASIYALVGAPNIPAYHAAKGAVRLMSKTDALIYAKNNIRVNSIYPGIIMTPLVKSAADNFVQGKEAFMNMMNSLHPLGHLGEPNDIAYGIVYLASDESKFVTGSELVIDGGYTAQ